jgi:hypothetical protein
VKSCNAPLIDFSQAFDTILLPPLPSWSGPACDNNAAQRSTTQHDAGQHTVGGDWCDRGLGFGGVAQAQCTMGDSLGLDKEFTFAWQLHGNAASQGYICIQGHTQAPAALQPYSPTRRTNPTSTKAQMQKHTWCQSLAAASTSLLPLPAKPHTADVARAAGPNAVDTCARFHCLLKRVNGRLGCRQRMKQTTGRHISVCRCRITCCIRLWTKEYGHTFYVAELQPCRQ